MYIIYETLSSIDPRRDERIKTVSDEWHYTIGFIEPSDEGNIDLESINASVITEGMANSHHFTNAVDGEVPIMRNVSNPKDIIQPTSYGDNDYEKINYKLTPTDELNAVGLLKAIMLKHAETYFDNDTGLVQIKTQVPQLTKLKETQMFMATYFEWDCAYTANKEKTPEFNTRNFSDTFNQPKETDTSKDTTDFI